MDSTLALVISIFCILFAIYCGIRLFLLKGQVSDLESKVEYFSRISRTCEWNLSVCRGDVERLESLLTQKQPGFGSSKIEKVDFYTNLTDFLQSAPFIDYFFSPPPLNNNGWLSQFFLFFYSASPEGFITSR